MKLAIHADPESAGVIQELLSVWDVSWVLPEAADVVIIYARKPLETAKKAVLIPSSSEDFGRWGGHSKPAFPRRPGKQVLIAATDAIALAITPDVLYEVDSSTVETNSDLIILQFDIVKEYSRIMRDTLTASSSAIYHLATSFPIPYNVAPKRLKNFLMKQHDTRRNLSLCEALPMDALRFALANAIQRLSKEKLCKKTWNNRACVCALTHDVDTKEGLRRSRTVKKLEEKYDAPSAWYIPSKQYALEQEIITGLENNGEIGAHDTKHDGKLFFIPSRK